MPSVGSAVMAWVRSTSGLLPIGNVKRGRTSHDPFCMVTIGSLWFALSRVIPHTAAFVLVSVLTWLPRRWAGGCSHCSQTPWRKPSLFLGQHGHFGWNALVGAGALQSPCLPAPGSLGSHQQERGWSSLSPSPWEPLSTCAFTASGCKRQICHRKR